MKRIFFICTPKVLMVFMALAFISALSLYSEFTEAKTEPQSNVYELVIGDGETILKPSVIQKNTGKSEIFKL